MSDEKDIAIELVEGSPVPGTWLNVASTIELAEENDEISVEVEGGRARKRTPVTGIVVTSRSGADIFVPVEMLEEDEVAGLVLRSRTGAAVPCVVKGCRNNSNLGEMVGSMCQPCWRFASGEEGGDSSQAYRNAVARKRRQGA